MPPGIEQRVIIMTSTLPAYNTSFNMVFANGNTAKAVRIKSSKMVGEALATLQMTEPRPVIFVSGGAGGMSDKDKRLTRNIIEAVGDFAEERNAVIVDGGTESGIMQMLGDVRRAHDHKFLLIGVSPLGKISYPGYKNPNEEAYLEDSHSHFVLVDGEEWGAESEAIVLLTKMLSGNGKQPSIGILINGGRIAMQEVYLATTHERKMSIIVLEGSGRAADDISTAFRTGKANQKILQAILAGGDIQLVGTIEGPDAMRAKLVAKFQKP